MWIGYSPSCHLLSDTTLNSQEDWSTALGSFGAAIAAKGDLR